MGLGRVARPARGVGVGHDGASVRRGVGAFGSVAGPFRRVDGPAPCDRRPRPCRPRAWAGSAACGASIGWPRCVTRRRGGSPRASPAVAKHYGVSVAICPPRHGNRKGVVEKANHTAAQRWWRTLPDDVTVEEAQASLDRLCVEPSSTSRVTRHRRSNVRPSRTTPTRTVAAGSVDTVPGHDHRRAARHREGAGVGYRGNFYSVPPELLHSTGHRHRPPR